MKDFTLEVAGQRALAGSDIVLQRDPAVSAESAWQYGTVSKDALFSRIDEEGSEMR